MTKKILALWLFFAATTSLNTSWAQIIETNQSTLNDDSTPPEDEIPNSANDAEINARLRQISSCIAPRFTREVRSYINGYTDRQREKTEQMLGKTVMYFPIFEKILAEKGLPADLKMLSVLESALNPSAVSVAGATGLWQFMAQTGNEYGLGINSWMDERRDVIKSTTAAAKYLSDLYNSFGDWSLAIAAYNSGPSRVNAAIKRGHSKNFWRIRPYLPQQTQNYVPAFIAANYILQFYKEHNLKPKYPALDAQITGVVRVNQNISFQLIASVTALPLSLVQMLNPAYGRDLVPANSQGSCPVVLPQRAIYSFQDYLEHPDSRPSFVTELVAPGITDNDDENYIKSTYRVEAGDKLEELAKIFNCGSEHLIVWNKLDSPHLYKGQELAIYLPKEIRRLKANYNSPTAETPTVAVAENTIVPVESSSTMEPASEIDNATTDDAAATEKLKSGKKSHRYLYYQIKRNETLSEVAEKYSGVSLRDLLRLNGIHNPKGIRAGAKIKIKEL